MNEKSRLSSRYKFGDKVIITEKGFYEGVEGYLYDCGTLGENAELVYWIEVPCPIKQPHIGGEFGVIRICCAEKDFRKYEEKSN